MASTDDKQTTDGGKLVKAAAPTNPRLAEAQRRAAALTSGQRVGAQQFFQEAIVELKKTTWPTREVLQKSTMVVLAFVFASAAFVGTIDFVLSKLFSMIPGH
ncbi:MAG: preprotein translocase subunit SecE [Capsulimonadaceae bacterium]